MGHGLLGVERLLGNIVTERIEILLRCPFVGSLVRASNQLPGGTAWFLPCTGGKRVSRLRHLGWEQCSRGIASRPLLSCHPHDLKEVCG